MKCRFFIDDEDPSVVDVDLVEMPTFIRLMRSMNIDKDGTFYRVNDVNYDVNQHAIDFICTKDEG